jgi:hypothetical protein
VTMASWVSRGVDVEPVIDSAGFGHVERSVSRGDDTAPVDVDRELRGGIRRPVVVDEAEGVLLVLGGFRLTVSERLSLLWVRLRIEARHGCRIGATFPELVVEREACPDLMSFGPDGPIRGARRETDHDADRPAYQPIIHAARPSAEVCFWDVLPYGRDPEGFDRLAFTIENAGDFTPILEFRLMVALAVSGVGAPLHLDMTPSVRRLERRRTDAAT